MKNINEMYDNKKSKKDLKLALKREFTLATKDTDFIELCNKTGLKEEELCKYTSKIETSVKELNNCKSCKGLGQCRNEVMGYYFYPVVKNNTLNFSYVACKYQKEEIKEKENEAIYFEVPKALKKAKLSEIIVDKERKETIKYITEFIKKFKNNEKMKGLYLHGNFGSGKSYMISALINELAKEGIDAVIVYYPKLLDKIKGSFSNNSFNDLLEEIMNSEVLLIDDIGAENNTAWARDEILGTILQHRMDNELTTFFTSNFTIEELEEHLSTTKDKTDKVKARRIISRIKQLTNDIELIGENRRK